MENKKMDYIPMWVRYLTKFRKSLSPHQLGLLTFAMLEYQAYGTEPQELDEVTEVFWDFIREDIIRAQLKYTQAVENGKKGGRPKKKPEKGSETPVNPTEPISTTTSTTTSTTSSASKTETVPPAAGSGEDLSVSETAYGEFGWVKLTKEQYCQLQAMMGMQELERCITYIDRSAQSTGNRNRWKDWALVLRRCFEGRWHEASQKQDAIPKGASGTLGQAELEAIQRVLQEPTDQPPDVLPFP